MEPPRLEGLEGFHVYGCLDGGGADRRTFTYDLAPVDARVSEIPSIPFPYFDPGPPPAYRVAGTAPIPIRVVAPAGSPESNRDLPSGGRGAPGAEEGPGGSTTLILAVLLAGVVLGFIAIRFRKGKREEADPRAFRLRKASAAFHEDLIRPGADPGIALAAFLAAFLDCPPAAVVGPDLAARLATTGVEEKTAAETAALMEALVATRFGGAPVLGGEEAARRLVEVIEKNPGKPER